MKLVINGETLSVSGGGLPTGTVAIKPLTKAEYDALTDDEKNADVVYAITDDSGGGSSGGGSSEEVYSTEETRIGTWIDGKPLYRMYLEGTLPNDTSVHFIIEYSEEFDVKMYQSYFERNDGFSTGTFCSPAAAYNSQSWIDTSQHKLGVQIGNSYISNVGGRKCWLIIEYTKTTDEAAS